MEEIKKKKLKRGLALALEIAAFLILAYIFIGPFYPAMRYSLVGAPEPELGEAPVNVKDVASSSDIDLVKQEARQIFNSFPESEYAVSPNRLIIKKIGVNAPIVESKNEQYGLSLGAWHLPESSTPAKGGNTVITGHRFKYLPPNNVTFYLFHKLEPGDIVTVIWGKEDYVYKIRETKVVPATEVSVVAPTKEPILTMFTCDPIYSTKNRLVVVAEPI